MVRIEKIKDQEYFQCEECGFHYEIKEMAQGCENWCRTHKSCNLEIIAEAIENKKE